MTPQDKQQAIDLLRRMVPERRERLADIDPRLADYYDHLCQHSGTEKGDANDLHNGYELLCALRLLRLLDTYPLNREKIDQVIYMGEGEWRQDSQGFWQHTGGGLGQPGRQGPEVYRWEPFQIFMIVAMYGPMAWISTENHEGDRRLTDTERINPQTREIEDLRRLCTRFILFGPRKINKSGFAAITNVEDFMFGDYDAQVVCTANSQEQSKILFGKTRSLLEQLDPISGRKFNGKYLNYTATEVKFMPGKYRAAELIAIPAGGKMPDGKFASRSAEDEYGSAGYTNGRSDMGQTAAVIESSMGPRREPMTVITTTASLITSGPFMEMLEATHRLLLQELKYPTGEAVPTLAEDRQMCLLLEPDDYEKDDEEYILTSRTLRRKVNPMLGKIVQHSFYDTQAAESRMDETKKRETIAKLFNVYRTGRITKWITGDKIRALQRPKRITDCKYLDEQGRERWKVYLGADFSHGDDLYAHGYLAVDYLPSQTMAGRFFFDCDAWVLESTMKESPLRQLYEQWVEQGWLHVCPGEVFDSIYSVNRLDELTQQGVNIVMINYDPAQSVQPINQIKAWLQTIFQKSPYMSGKDIADMIKRMVVPISQTAMSQNPVIGHIEEMILRPEPWIEFSENPIIPWCFGNAAVEITSSDLRRIVKGGPQATHKIDVVAAMEDAVHGFDIMEGRIEE